MVTSQQAPAHDTLRLMLVEDNPLFTEQLTDAIHGLHGQYEIVQFSEGRPARAHALASVQNFHLILVDLGLPDISGLEVIRACREKDPEVPIVVFSVVASENMVLEAIEAGANGYILKDESIQEITQAITDVFKGIYPLSPRLARYLFKQLAQSPGTSSGAAPIKLSPREQETLQHLAQGQSYEQVAASMGVSLSTVQSNVRSLYRKLNVKSQSQAVSKALDHKLL